MRIYAGISDVSIQKIESMYKNKSIPEFKSDLSDHIIKELYPIHLKA